MIQLHTLAPRYALCLLEGPMRRNVGTELLASNAACRVATQVPDAAAREPERCATEQTLQVEQSVGP